MQMYVSKFCEENPSMTTSEKAFLQKTVTTSFAPISASGRGKRQATRPRLRKEIRTMTITERARYFNALTRLKRDTVRGQWLIISHCSNRFFRT
ncbi:hypothetical protein DPMN_008918 [Dreissena polymorpha]|uniref:Uncharacterized protein n=1 Tax=Dreissena polymorpha TaxID=45954 RepID=A0A9D4MW06_DREPO|nr:hypothetical protein DPMN_008918 [Dreissena polymorpha]